MVRRGGGVTRIFKGGTEYLANLASVVLVSRELRLRERAAAAVPLEVEGHFPNGLIRTIYGARVRSGTTSVNNQNSAA
jgi:hypothetical protein